MSTFQWLAVAGMIGAVLFMGRDWLKGLLPGKTGNDAADAFAMLLSVRAELTELGHTPEAIDALTMREVPSCLAHEANGHAKK